MKKYYSIRVISGETEEEAMENLLNEKFDEDDPLCDRVMEAESLVEELHRNIKDTMYVGWCIDDFEYKAHERECLEDAIIYADWDIAEPTPIYDRSKFHGALHHMVCNHDPSIGITWDTIDYYLDEFCKL